MSDTTYQSPLAARIGQGKRLTLEFLIEWVPLYQAGKDAEDVLAGHPPDLTDEQEQQLRATVRRGQEAADMLVVAAIPLVRMLALKEWRRRQTWESVVGFNELLQEGMIGLLRGLRKYDPAKVTRAPTHYLGQWIITEMRRGVEHLDHDFAVPYDTAERFRRIRALSGKVAENPDGDGNSVHDIVEQSAAPVPSNGIQLGRKDAKPRSTPAVTADQVIDEQHQRTRVGVMTRLHSTTPGGDDSEREVSERKAHSVTDDAGHDVAEQLGSEWAAVFLQSVIADTLVYMGLPEAQQQIIRLTYGLPPELREHSYGITAAKVGVSRKFVEAVIEAFQAEMGRPGGTFHRMCLRHPVDQLADAGLGWVLTALGSRAVADPRYTMPDVLTVPPQTEGETTPPPIPVKGSGVFATFRCPIHKRSFLGSYRYRSQVPDTRQCPSCETPCPVTDITEQT